MKAVCYTTPGPLDGAGALKDIEISIPSAAGHDLLVKVRSVSVNPVDTKVRGGRPTIETDMGILGYDAVGEVVEVGEAVTLFQPGDHVWYAGAINRRGTNAEYHLVDERIVGRKPESLSDAEAAALPLTTLTAWEMLFDRLRVTDPVPGVTPSILIIGGAGGVGSIAIQILRAMTDFTVIATASRSETQDWVRALGAHHVVDHSKPLPAQFTKMGLDAPGFVFSTNQTQNYVEQIAELIAPQGRFGLIDDPEGGMNIMPFKIKAVSAHWELMFTRPIFGTTDMARQGEILTEMAALVDAGKIKSTVTGTLGKIDAATLTKAHKLIESGKAKGKIVLEGF